MGNIQSTITQHRKKVLIASAVIVSASMASFVFMVSRKQRVQCIASSTVETLQDASGDEDGGSSDSEGSLAEDEITINEDVEDRIFSFAPVAFSYPGDCIVEQSVKNSILTINIKSPLDGKGCVRYIAVENTGMQLDPKEHCDHSIKSLEEKISGKIKCLFDQRGKFLEMYDCYWKEYTIDYKDSTMHVWTMTISLDSRLIIFHQMDKDENWDLTLTDSIVASLSVESVEEKGQVICYTYPFAFRLPSVKYTICDNDQKNVLLNCTWKKFGKVGSGILVKKIKNDIQKTIEDDYYFGSVKEIDTDKYPFQMTLVQLKDAFHHNIYLFEYSGERYVIDYYHADKYLPLPQDFVSVNNSEIRGNRYETKYFSTEILLNSIVEEHLSLPNIVDFVRDEEPAVATSIMQNEFNQCFDDLENLASSLQEEYSEQNVTITSCKPDTKRKRVHLVLKDRKSKSMVMQFVYPLPNNTAFIFAAKSSIEDFEDIQEEIMQQISSLKLYSVS